MSAEGRCASQVPLSLHRKVSNAGLHLIRFPFQQASQCVAASDWYLGMAGRRRGGLGLCMYFMLRQRMSRWRARAFDPAIQGAISSGLPHGLHALLGVQGCD